MDNLISVVRSVLAMTPARCVALTDNLPAELVTRKPAPGEWSAAECIQHLLDTEHIFPSRIRSFLAGKDFAAFDPDRQGSPAGQRTPSEIAHEYASLRLETLKLLDTLTQADLSRRVKHAELGPVSLNEMMNEWAAHELMHVVQAERAVMQPFIAESGPWIRYFKDHIAN